MVTLDGVSKSLPFSDIGEVSINLVSALTADVPTFVRLNKTFGENASKKWLYLHLKNLLIRFLVDHEKMADSQIDFLANIIVSNHPTMKLLHDEAHSAHLVLLDKVYELIRLRFLQYLQQRLLLLGRVLTQFV